MHCARARGPATHFSGVMNDSYSLITSLVTGFGLALPFGYCFERFLRTPALVGYICAGLAVGFIPGLPELDVGMLEQLAEIGVMLLMFGVGLHFSVQNLFSVKGVAVPGAALQMLLATTLGGLFAAFVWHWSVGQAVMFGLTISCASTVVVTKALEIRRLTTSMNGQVAIGWLVVQDLVSVLFLVLLPPFAQMIHGTADVSVSAVALDVVKTLAGVALFVFLAHQSAAAHRGLVVIFFFFIAYHEVALSFFRISHCSSSNDGEAFFCNFVLYAKNGPRVSSARAGFSFRVSVRGASR